MGAHAPEAHPRRGAVTLTAYVCAGQPIRAKTAAEGLRAFWRLWCSRRFRRDFGGFLDWLKRDSGYGDAKRKVSPCVV